MIIKIKELILESDFLSDEHMNNLSKENFIYKQTHPIEAKHDQVRLFNNLTNLAKDMREDPVVSKMNINEVVPENPIATIKLHMSKYLTSDGYNNPTVPKLFNHMKTQLNAYDDVEKHIANLPNNEQEAINKAIATGNSNINIREVLKGKPLFNNYNDAIEKQMNR